MPSPCTPGRISSLAILVDESSRIIVQGITGREARLRTSLMLDSGSVVVAGVTPGRGGESFQGVPVYNSVQEAKANQPEANASVIFVPAAVAKDATFEAIDAGIGVICLVPERLPHHDSMEVIAHAKHKGSVVVGPNSPGIFSPGKALLGGLGGQIQMQRTAFRPGPVGIISRSGGNTMTLAYYLTKAGFGQSTAVGVGGDAFIGATWKLLLDLFEKDDQTEAVVAYGEIGGANEEEAAAAIAAGAFTKPFVVFVAGKYAQAGMRFGHAGAIISAGRGSAQGKIAALREAGAVVVDHLEEIGDAVATALARR